MQKQKEQLDWIQALRGVAVLLVLLTHARLYFLETPQWPQMDQLLLPGAMGVDLFFIISGFIMVHTTAGAAGGRAAALFGIKRLARIWPAYAAVVLLWIWLALGGLDFFRQPGNSSAFIKSLLLLPVDLNQPPFFGLVFPLGWTLAFEMYFYLVFGLSMLLGRWRWLGLAGWMGLTLVLLPRWHGGSSFEVRDNLHFAGYLNLMTNPIIYEFLFGVLIGLLYRQRWARIPSATLAWQLLLVSAGFALWYGFSGVGAFHGPTHWGWPLALMVLAMALASKTIVLNPPRWLVWTGTVSYSMYLTHFLGQTLLTRWMQARGIDTHTWSQVFITLLCAFPLAALAHLCLERGLGEWTRRALMRLFAPWLPAPDTAARTTPGGNAVRIA
ncbi:acyltransferase [Massilia sp. BJB1822]|uniref:acyltransferase family protein n=1 Tax=Massilia sp. BJB1822 TaxID=2744470 RepID=UPI0015940F39|nr:acyltransferase [Massilia sp. BJB1822]NVE01444.1 acyltransferase [Massilia sp. BJB1822]